MTFKLATHNGHVTIKNTNTDNHRTFRIRTQAEDSTFAPGKRVVGLKVGDNPKGGYAGYQNFAFLSVDDEGNTSIQLWRRFRGNKLFETYAKMLVNREPFEAKGAVYMEESWCRRCNRELTNPTSIETGIGPVCAGLVGA